MFMSDINNIKIYNLSAGKSIPEWLTDRRKRSQLKKKVDSCRQIELIQDFNMPGVATSIKMSPDNQYILATGTYKPRVKCFEVLNLSIKFERCFDSEITTFEVLDDDYSKLVFLQCDRFIEIHAAHGRHYRLRIPRVGRDMNYHKPSCDLFIVGTSSEIYRLNLERGQFLQPFQTDASCLNTCDVNPEHHLLVVGSQEGIVEAWDPRDKKKCATLDVAMKLPEVKEFPSISTLKFKNGLHMGVGTTSGHVLLYDIRSSRPLLIKDHLNKLPIKKIDFNSNANVVYSLDSAMLKIWDENSGKQKTFIESQTDFNDFCTIKNTGMFFFAQEDVKMLTYYIPAFGPAPKWCSFLDNLAEEIESEVVENIYDDYQFLTKKELEELGLDHLIGTDLLRAYMHGYFINLRLYKKAKAIAEPFTFDKYRKEKIRQEIEGQRESRLQIKKDLPRINQDLAIKLLEQNEESKNKSPNLLQDNRFKVMFENPDFTIDKNAEEYKMLEPVLNRLEKQKTKKAIKRTEVARVEELHADENQKQNSSDDDEDLFHSHDDNDSESSDDDAKEFSKEMKQAYKGIKKDRLEANLENDQSETITKDTVMQEINENSEFKINSFKIKPNKLSLKKRLEKQSSLTVVQTGNNLGNKQVQFDIKKASSEMKKRHFEMKKHKEERKKLVRPITTLKMKKIKM